MTKKTWIPAFAGMTNLGFSNSARAGGKGRAKSDERREKKEKRGNIKIVMTWRFNLREPRNNIGRLNLGEQGGTSPSLSLNKERKINIGRSDLPKRTDLGDFRFYSPLATRYSL
ncbi:MAG: hypothetical protein HY978_01040 [Candidatus Liptonbacteria bacterium]|nr:hypothetical protein [Candidatus Liptonbacteria bacterium]